MWVIEKWKSLPEKVRYEVKSGLFTVASSVVTELGASGILDQDFDWSRGSLIFVGQVVVRTAMKQVFALLMARFASKK